MTRRDSFLDDVLRQARSGDRRAWGELYDRLLPRMQAVAASFPTVDREAVVHDVFATCLERNFPGYRGGSLLAYVAKAVRNRCIDETRLRRQSDLSLDEAPEIGDHLAPGPEEQVIRNDLLAWAFVRGGISGGDQLLLRLDAEGYSNSEIAGRVAMNPGQVAVRLHRARRRLTLVGPAEAPGFDLRSQCGCRSRPRAGGR